MNKKKSIILLAGLSIICLGLALFYFSHARGWVSMAYEGNAPVWLENLMQLVYPRFEVEKHRFELSFFINKADQLVFRLIFLAFITALYFILARSGHYQQRLESFWNRKEKRKKIRNLIIVFYLGVIYYCADWLIDLSQFWNIHAFYKPIPIYKALGINFPSVSIIFGIYLTLILASLSIVVRVKPLLFSIIATFCFIYLQGLMYSFEKTDHRYATLTYAMILMPFLIYEEKNAGEGTLQKGWPLQLIKVSIVLVYFFAGIEKLFTSGFSWVSVETFRTYIYLHQAPVGLLAAKNEWAALFLSTMALVFQLGSILVLFFPRLTTLFIIGGISFHAGTVLLFGIGDYFTPWLFVYIFFINWKFLSKYTMRKLVRGKIGMG
jgi:hypothetical protein